jgi:hypothetical protein
MAVPGLHALRRLRRRRVAKRLLPYDGAGGSDEVIITDGAVHHHWAAYAVPALWALLAVVTLWLGLVSSTQVGWFFLLLGVGLGVHAGLKALRTFMDVFVITNFRVFRVSGLPGFGPTKYASTPLSRILDITVDQTSLGQLLGYGHFTFESAAQEQGLRDIRFVSRPLQRDRIIQQQQLRLLRKQPLPGQNQGQGQDGT